MMRHKCSKKCAMTGRHFCLSTFVTFLRLLHDISVWHFCFDISAWHLCFSCLFCVYYVSTFPRFMSVHDAPRGFEGVCLLCRLRHAWVERDPQSEAAVSSRTIVTFGKWSSSRTKFLVLKVFCNDIYSSSFSCTWRRIKREVILSRVWSNTNTFAPDDLAQCLSCVLLATWCAFGAHRQNTFQTRNSVLELDLVTNVTIFPNETAASDWGSRQ